MRGEVGVASERFSLTNPDLYILQGIWPKGGAAEVWLDKEKLVAEIEEDTRPDSSRRFINRDMAKEYKIRMKIWMPQGLECRKKLIIYVRLQGHKYVWFKIRTKKLIKKQRPPHVLFEEILREAGNGFSELKGWTASTGDVQISLTDGERKPVQAEIQRLERNDVREIYDECKIGQLPGFVIRVKKDAIKRICLLFQGPEGERKEEVSLGKAAGITEKMDEIIQKSFRYFRRHGGLASVQKLFSVLSGDNKPVRYSDWIKKHLRTKKELEQQRQEKFERSPRFSIVVPLYKTPRRYLEDMIESVKAQTYGKWELCLSDGSGPDSDVWQYLCEQKEQDHRIKIVCSEKPLNIADNTNAALQLATGDFVAFMDHDDVITPDALCECVRAFNKNPETEIFYSDEDKMSMDGKRFFEPHMKPDFNLDLLRTVNYICHLFVVKDSLLKKAGNLRAEYDGAQDYDLILRCIETSGNIYHIPRVLYHWRSHDKSTAENPESKAYAFDAGRRALQAHFDRVGIRAKVFQGEFPGLYRTRYIRDYDPLVSILIPNKDHTDDLKRCIRSIEEKSSYRNYEYIIIENNSVEEETFACYRQLEAENPKVTVVRWNGKFNYSAINNFGEKAARGEYLLLLNNDTAIINEDCLEELLGYCMREDVGAVGARLYYEDNTIQHAGVVIGFGGIAGHCFVQQRRDTTGYCHRIICAQNYSAVTAACMMVKRSAFHKVGGLNEKLKVAFNDIDFCLRLGKAGYRIVYNPYAELYHFESKSRGVEDTPEKMARFKQEIETFQETWPEILEKGDPYYNPNLSLDNPDFSLKRI